MESEQIERLRDKLEELAREIDQYLQESEASAAAVEPDKGLGRLSRMEAMQDQQMFWNSGDEKKDNSLMLKMP